jgi:hypothetical protein
MKKMNKPGSPRSAFNNAQLEPAKLYRCLQHYIQALLRHCPHDVERLVQCPEGEDRHDWIYWSCRQFVQELNYYAYEHRDVSTFATEPEMKFLINGQKETYRVFTPDTLEAVPAIDYITQTIDSATGTLLDQKLFRPGWPLGQRERGLASIATFFRRLYRIFLFSYSNHREIFERLEQQSHLCERFTKFARINCLFDPEDVCIPDRYWEGREQ